LAKPPLEAPTWSINHHPRSRRKRRRPQLRPRLFLTSSTVPPSVSLLQRSQPTRTSSTLLCELRLRVKECRALWTHPVSALFVFAAFAPPPHNRCRVSTCRNASKRRSRVLPVLHIISTCLVLRGTVNSNGISCRLGLVCTPLCICSSSTYRVISGLAY
jgi:hypothetical protein